MLGCLLAWSGPSFSDVAHNEYPDTDLGIRLTRDPMPTWTGWSVPWPALELFLTRIILAPQSRHLRGRSRAATASWMLWTKQRRHNAWWPQGETCITDRAWQQTMHWNEKKIAILQPNAHVLNVALSSTLFENIPKMSQFHRLWIYWSHGVWKSQKKSHSTLRAKRATFAFWVDKS